MASGELLSMLQKSARSGTLLSSCEPEVKELMHQLDVLISEHQREWEEKMRETQEQLKLRDKELTTLRISLQERTDQLERVRLQSLQVDQEHRARHADCEAQLVRVRSELSRLRHSYEQLRAKRNLQNQQKATAVCSHGRDTTNYRQECHSLRRQLAEVKEKEREMERECRELRERLKKSNEDMKGVEIERRQSQQSVAYLQETLRSKEGLIRDLEEKVSVVRSSISCQSELEQMRGKITTLLEGERRLKDELRSHLEQEKRLNEELKRVKREGDKWKQQLDKVKVQQARQESDVVRRLEERVQNLEHQLRESEQTSSGKGVTQHEAIGQFEEQTERLIHTPGPVDMTGSGHRYTANREGGEGEQWSQLLESVLGKHFDQLDSSLQRMLSPN